MIGIKENHFL